LCVHKVVFLQYNISLPFLKKKKILYLSDNYNTNNATFPILKSNTCICQVLQICPMSLLHQQLLVILKQYFVFATVKYDQSGFHCFKLLKRKQNFSYS